MLGVLLLNFNDEHSILRQETQKLKICHPEYQTFSQKENGNIWRMFLIYYQKEEGA